MSEEALTPSIKRGFILIRDDFQREGESYVNCFALMQGPSIMRYMTTPYIKMLWALFNRHIKSGKESPG